MSEEINNKKKGDVCLEFLVAIHLTFLNVDNQLHFLYLNHISLP